MTAALRLLPFLAVLLLSLLCSVQAATYTVLLGWQTVVDQYGPAWYSLYFYPTQLTIVYGDSVTWIWNSGESHNVVFSNGTFLADTAADGSSLLLIAGIAGNQTVFTDYGQTYSSGIQTNFGAPYTLQFLPNTGSGNFTFYCSIHESMVGVLQVLPAGSTAPMTPAQVNASTNAEIAQLEAVAQAQIASLPSPATGPGVKHTTRADGTTAWVVQAGAMWMQPGVAMYARFIPSYLEVHVGDTVEFVTVGDDPHMVYFNASNQFQLIYTNWSPTQRAPLNISINKPNPNYPLGFLPPPYSGSWPNAAGHLYSGLLFDPTVFVGLPFPQVYNVTFTQAGSWQYMCPIHYDIGMQAQVVVKAAGAALCTNPAIASTCAQLTSNAGGVLGDPQFKGLRGQSYQVHGIDGAVYNLISDDDVQLNARFAFRTGPRPCPTLRHAWTEGEEAAPISCWSHDGSYLAELGLQTGSGERLLVKAGEAKDGFAAVQVGSDDVQVGKKAASSVSVVRHSTHHLTVVAGQWTLHVENSDGFVNIAGVSVSTPISELTSHGLLGQTHRRVKGNIEGDVDDYMVAENDVFGVDFPFNQFQA